MKHKCQYEIVHDNLNNQWLLVDLSNKKYKFYYKCDITKTTKRLNTVKKKKSFFF